MSSVNNIALSNPQGSRIAIESKVDMQNVSTDSKLTRVNGQNEDNYINLATSQNQKSSADQQYSHQHHIALQAYLNLGKDEEQQKANQEQSIENIEHGIGTDAKQTEESQEKKNNDPQELTEEEEQQVRDMQERDREVRTHEQAHKSAGGQYAGAPSYSYETGPDGKRYVTDGEVQIDIGEEDDPQDTITKMQIVKRAAIAPQEPSAQDRRVYAEASQKEARARQELAEEQREEQAQNSQNPNNQENNNVLNQNKQNENNNDLDKVPTPKNTGAGTKSLDA